MATINVKCPYCGSEHVNLFGHSKSGKQRFRCMNKECSHITFQLELTYNARKPGVAQKIVDMSMNGSGTRDTARVLGIDKDTVTRHLRKLGNFVENVNQKFLDKMEEGASIDIHIVNPLEDSTSEEDPQSSENADIDRTESPGLSAELDEQWSYCGSKKNQEWLWWATEHEHNIPLAFCFGTREYKNLDVLLSYLKPFNIKIHYTDNNFAYSSRIAEENLHIGKRDTQKIERNHLTLRTRIKRLARKTICFSKSEEIHKAVIGAFINIHYFGREYVA